ncbi:MAG: S9 family peptidase [Gemmatimonadetes bacterium]|nr:MAG: S9 family peptidase [Gemmatimonadota bacterium]
MRALSKIRLLIGIALILPTARTLSQSPSTLSPPLTAPPRAPVRTVVDEYFGNKVEDPYRYMEDLKAAEVQAWFKAQNDYTRGVLARIPGRDALAKRIKELDESAVARVYDLRRLPGEHYFYQKRLASEEMGKIYVRNGINAPEKLIVDPVKITPAGSPSFVLNYYTPSYDASKLAYGASPGGSEDAVIHTIDVATGREFPETIDRSWFGGPAWLPDGHAFFHNRMQKMLPGMPVTEREQKSTVYLHVPGTDPETDRAVFGYNVSTRVKIVPTDLPFAFPSGNSPWLFGLIGHGVQNEITLYATPVASINDRDIPWRKIVDVDDEVTAFDVHGDDIYLVSHKGAPRFKVVRTSIGNPDFAQATVVVPESDAVIRNVATATDALYVQLLDGGIGKILRIPFTGPNAGVAQKISLPVDGQVWFDAIDPRVSGALFGLTSWNRAASDYAYDPATNRITETTLVPHGPFDFPSDVVAEEVRAPSYDGTLVPLSIVHKKGLALDGSNPTLLDGYGSYGITLDPYFDPMMLAWIERGGVYAVAHVRGGGEYGEGWHLAGKLLNKHNTWRDFIASAQYLIDHKYTSPARLGGQGTSAGGITIGRAITERPDLFAAAIDNVGLSDVVRVEESANGVPNIPEFGTNRTPKGFQAVYEMSTYHHIKDGTAYPAVLVTTGINDPRVTPWEPAKLLARLQAATSSGKPVLLRVEYEGGHGGIAMTKTQWEQLLADQWSFLLWQFGVPGFQP